MSQTYRPQRRNNETIAMSENSLLSAPLIAGLAIVALAAIVPAQAQIGREADRGYHGLIYHFAGHEYCWYEHAWRGPGWYICGYQWHRDFGWGGRYGWHSWYPYGHHQFPREQHPRPSPGRAPSGGKPATRNSPPINEPGSPPSVGESRPR